MSDALNDLISKHACELASPEHFNKAAILHAIAEVESKHGQHSLASLHEPAYCYKGFYFRSPNGEDLRRLSSVWGCLAHSSYSSWQILFITAYELGFRGDPCLLRNDTEAIHWVIKLLNRRVFDRWPRLSLEGLADAYNSGNPRDENVPTDYIAKFSAAYERWLKEFSQ